MEDILGPAIEDADEESFLTFSQTIPSHLALGFLDPKALSVEITIRDRTLVIQQSPSLLTSQRDQGTTGAVVWKTTALFAEWLADSFLFRKGFLGRESMIVELGAGVSGIVALALGHLVKKYIATDQDYVLKLLKKNIDENVEIPFARPKTKKHHAKITPTSKTATTPAIITLELDWEIDPLDSLSPCLRNAESSEELGGVDAIVACDTIYNESLISPFNSTCAQICSLRSPSSIHPQHTFCIIAQQLRSFDVFQAWLVDFHERFHVWRVPDHQLSEGLRENSGYVVHVGIVR